MLYAHIFKLEQEPNAPDIGPLTAQAFWRANTQFREKQIEKAGIKKAPPKK